MIMRSILVSTALAAVFASQPALASFWRVDQKQCIASASVKFDESRNAIVSFIQVGEHAAFRVAVPNWNLPAFGSIDDAWVEIGAGARASGKVVQQSPNIISVVWTQTDVMKEKFENEPTARFRVMLEGDKELLSFPPNLGSAIREVEACVTRVSTI